MAGQVTAASTLVASILEHQGLLTQAAILDGFQGFFRDAGALLYLIAGVGAVASILLYGSFKAPRYLLIGPALFWFLVGPRAEGIDGVVWKLGDGATLGFNHKDDPNAEYRKKVLKKSGFDPDAQPKVAQAFWLFAATINEMTNEMVGVMLKKEDTSDLLVASRAYGLELINTGKIDEGQLLSNAEQGLMLGCQEMVAEAQAAAAILVKTKLGNTNQNDIQSGFKDALYKEHIEAMKKAGEKSIDPKFGTLIKPLTDKIEIGTNIQCKKVWELVSTETWHRSASGMARIVRVASQGAKKQALVDFGCEGLVRKSVADDGKSAEEAGNRDCNIQPAVALALLNNHLTQSHAYNRVFNRHWNEGAFKNPRTLVALTPGGAGIGTNGGFQIQNGIGQMVIGGLAKFGSAIGLVKTEDAGNGMVKYTLHMTPITVLQQEYGLNDAMWVSTRQFELVKLRQKIFSYALNIPYYQGMLLYIIAVMYPFMALLVIVPGKAIGFLNVPMAWLWVKSWDIGFAAIIVLDRILFNLLPSPNIDKQLRTGPWTDLELLPKVMAEAYNYDPIGSLHNYYSILAFVWLSVPVISGFITLKAKRGILSMFPDAAEGIAAETAAAASEAYSILAQDKRTALLKELGGAAARTPISGSNTIGQGMPGITGKFFGTMAMAGQTDKFKFGEMFSGKAAKAADSIDAAKKWNETYGNITMAETRLQSRLARSFDPVMGRWGDFGLLQGAYTAAMDGGGGYELYDHDDVTSISNELIAAVVAKEEVMLETMNNATSNFAKGVTSSLINGAKGDYNMMVSRMGDSGLVMTAMMGVMTNTSDSEAFRKAIGAEGYTHNEIATAFTNQIPQVYDAAPITANSATPDSFDALFGASTVAPPPGGFSQFLNNSLSAIGGNREVRYEHNPTLAAKLSSTTVTPAERSRGIFQQISQPLSTTAAIATNTMSSLFTSTDATDPSLINSDNVFRGGIQADNLFQAAAQPFYSEQVKSRSDRLIQHFGTDNIKNFFSEQGRGINGNINAGHLAEYSEHLYASGNQGNGSNPADQKYRASNGLDTRYTDRVDQNPLAALDAIESWLVSRGKGYRNNNRLSAIPNTGPIISKSYQLWGNDD